MTTEASKSDLTAALTQLSHNLEALPGKIAAQVAAEVAALKPRRSPSAEGPTTMTPTVEAVLKARSSDIARATKQQNSPRSWLVRLFSGRATVPQPVGDVAQTLAALKKLADKKFGANEDLKRHALTAEFGKEISDLILQ